MVTNSWLEQVKEEIVDRERPIIDPHHHLWSNKESGDYLTHALKPQGRSWKKRDTELAA